LPAIPCKIFFSLLPKAICYSFDSRQPERLKDVVMLRIVTALLIASTATVAAAQDPFTAADAKLNALYKQIEARLAGDPSTLHLLTAAQRSWITFRDAECTFSSSGAKGGSVYPDVVTSCKAGLTEKRVADFNAYLHCQEGDMGCPVPGK
jgi:uncharacterized protein YecT (DUF1311 family)